MIKKVAFTGEPSSGKTTIIERIKKVYEPLGYKVIVIDETATYIINKGISPAGENCVDLIDFQELVMRLQLEKESLVDRYIEMLESEGNFLIIYDRGTIDNSAYVNKTEFEEVLKRVKTNKNHSELLIKYDLVIDLIGGKEYYTTENNKARSETVEEAIELREKTLRSWLGHPNIKIVLPKPDMEDKIKEVLNMINEILKEEVVKRQEKYLVDLTKSNLNYLKQKGKPALITQDYLISPEGSEKRIRKVELNGSTYYYLSEYRIKEDGTKIIEKEKNIDKKVYEILLDFKEENSTSIQKTRIYFGYNGKYFYLDVFNNNDELGILEINITEDEKVETPDFLYVLENVTNNEKYYNRNIAESNSRQLKLNL